MFVKSDSCLLFFQGFNGTVALVANLSLSLIDSCVMWWISFTQPATKQLLRADQDLHLFSQVLQIEAFDCGYLNVLCLP